MTIQTITTAYINSCLDVNSSWRDFFNEITLLWTLGLDLDAGPSIIGDCIRENLVENGYEEEVNDQEVDGLIYGYLNAEYTPFTKEQILAMGDWVDEVVGNIGCEEQLAEWLNAN